MRSGGAGALRHQYPLPLHHSWPLFERASHFDLGWVDRRDVRPPASFATVAETDAEAMARAGIDTWECNLTDNSLTWSSAVYDLFGMPQTGRASCRERVGKSGWISAVL